MLDWWEIKLFATSLNYYTSELLNTLMIRWWYFPVNCSNTNWWQNIPHLLTGKTAPGSSDIITGSSAVLSLITDPAKPDETEAKGWEDSTLFLKVSLCQVSASQLPLWESVRMVCIILWFLCSRKRGENLLCMPYGHCQCDLLATLMDLQSPAVLRELLSHQLGAGHHFLCWEQC